MKRRKPLLRDRGENRTDGKRAKKKISAKNQGVLDDSGESVKGTDPVDHHPLSKQMSELN